MPVVKSQRRRRARTYEGDPQTCRYILVKRVEGLKAKPGDDVTEEMRRSPNLRALMKRGRVRAEPEIDHRKLGNTPLEEQPPAAPAPREVNLRALPTVKVNVTVPTVEQAMADGYGERESHGIVAAAQATAEGATATEAQAAGETAMAAWDEIQEELAEARYQDALARGLSEAEARAEGWPDAAPAPERDRVPPTLQMVMDRGYTERAAYIIMARETAVLEGKHEGEVIAAEEAAFDAVHPGDGDGGSAPAAASPSDPPSDGEAAPADGSGAEGATAPGGVATPSEGDGQAAAGDGDGAAEGSSKPEGAETTPGTVEGAEGGAAPAETETDSAGATEEEPAPTEPVTLSPELEDLKRLNGRTSIADIRAALKRAEVEFDDEQGKHKPTLLRLASEAVTRASAQ